MNAFRGLVRCGEEHGGSVFAHDLSSSPILTFEMRKEQCRRHAGGEMLVDLCRYALRTGAGSAYPSQGLRHRVRPIALLFAISLFAALIRPITDFVTFLTSGREYL